jgi:hypothetical protein
MSLLDLKTNLRSLKFGGDRFDGGSSKQPFIQTAIPSTNSDPSVNNPDFILRQGAIRDSLVDVERLGKWFTTPAGLQFIAKQELLSRLAVRTQASVSPLNDGIYNPLLTLFQAGVTALGIHINKQGLLPEGANGNWISPAGKYADRITVGRVNFPATNRLVTLYNTSVPLNPILRLYPGGPGSELGIGPTLISYATDRYGVPLKTLDNERLLTLGGDNRYINERKNNIDKTILDTRRTFNFFNNGASATYTNNSNLIDLTNETDNPLYYYLGSNAYYYDGYSYIQNFQTSVYQPGSLKSSTRIDDNNTDVWSSEQIQNAPALQGNTIGANNDGVIDFRTILNNYDSLPYSGSDHRNIESRLNLGDPGTRFANRKNYVLGASNNVDDPKYGAAAENSFDKINALPLYKASYVNADTKNAASTNDLVQFRLAAIDGDNPNQKIFMHFRAFLDGINDSYTGDWSATKYVGRGENFYTYQGFDRKVSFGFTTAAQSKAELMPMYRKLNFLASNLAPDYSTRGFMRGPLMQLSIGGYFYEQPGFITSLTYEISQDYTWEIGVGTSPNSKTGQIIGWSDGSVKELPHVIKVNIQFTPIHTFRPQKVNFGKNINTEPDLSTDDTIGNYPNTRYIALANGFGSRYNNYDEPINFPPKLTPSPDPNTGILGTPGNSTINNTA